MKRTFRSTLRMLDISEETQVFDQGIEMIKVLAAFGGVIFTAAFLILSLRLAFAYRGYQRGTILKHMAFTAVAALIHYSAWQLAPRLGRIFFYPVEYLTVQDRSMYIIRWIAAFGGTLFTLSFMCLGLYVAFVGVRPEQRIKFYSGMVSTLLATILFYSSWMFAPIIAGEGLQSSGIDDKPIFILKTIGSMGGLLFTFVFLFLSLKLTWGSVRPDRRMALYKGLIFAFIGTFLFYTAWQFAPAIANTILPSPVPLN
jgi:hypothetical protein